MYEQIVIAEQRVQNIQRMESFIPADSVVYTFFYKITRKYNVKCGNIVSL